MTIDDGAAAELVAKWRHHAESVRERQPVIDWELVAGAYDTCADELAGLIAASGARP